MVEYYDVFISAPFGKCWIKHKTSNLILLAAASYVHAYLYIPQTLYIEDYRPQPVKVN